MISWRGSLPLAASLLQALTVAVNNCTTVHPNVTHTGTIKTKLSRCQNTLLYSTGTNGNSSEFVWEVPSSNLSRHAEYPETLRGFSRYLKANGGIVAQICVHSIPSICFSSHFTARLCDRVLEQIRVCINKPCYRDVERKWR